MSGLLAAIGNGEREDLDPLLQQVKHRGISQEAEKREQNKMVVLKDTHLEGQEITAALDGYLLFPQREEILQGYDGEKKLNDTLKKNGTSCLHGVEGEFALAVNGRGGDYLLARDPLGVKPLYYTKQNEILYLAPEIKALLPLKTPIQEVPPGCYFEAKTGWVQYYQLPEGTTDTSLTFTEAQERIRDILYLSVEEKTSNTGVLGVYLSGGLDSSIVAALTAELADGPISTYTVGIKGSRDIKYAAKVAQDLQTHHHIHTYDLEEMLEVLPEVIYHLESFDCAYVRSAIPNFLAARMAAEDGREIMLTGEGSDELFAGYSYLKELTSPQKIQAEMQGFIENLCRTGLQRVDRMNSAHGLDYRVPFLKPALLDLVQTLPLDWKLYRGKDDPVDKWILRQAYEKELGSQIAWREKEQFDEGSGSSNLLSGVAKEAISDSVFENEAEEAPVLVRNKEELFYYRIFREFFPEHVLPLVGRWTKTS